MIGATIFDPASMGRPDLPNVFGAWDFDNNEDITEFTATAIAGGANAVVANLPNGVTRFSGAATTNASGFQIQLESTPVRLDAPDAFAFVEARFRLNDAKETLTFGFSDTNAALLTSLTDAVVIQKAAGAGGGWTLVVKRSTGSATTVNIPALIGDLNYHTIKLDVIVGKGTVAGNGSVKIHVDGKVLYEGDVAANLPYDDNLTPSLAILSGDNVGTQTADLDFLRYKASRSLL